LDGEQAIRDALAEGPTSGPWVADDNEGFSSWTVWSRMTPSGNGKPGPMVAQVIGDSAEADANAALVAACNPEAMRALLAELDRLRASLSTSKQAGAEPVIAVRGVDASDGFWRSCSGCHELNEGHDTGAYSSVFKCALGVGCSECGGLGVVWDNTDHQAMADSMAQGMNTPNAAPGAAIAQPTTVQQAPLIEQLGEALEFYVGQAHTAKGAAAMEAFRQWQDLKTAPTVAPGDAGGEK
jgi:hypothetical protein